MGIESGSTLTPTAVYLKEQCNGTEVQRKDETILICIRISGLHHPKCLEGESE